MTFDPNTSTAALLEIYADGGSGRTTASSEFSFRSEQETLLVIIICASHQTAAVSDSESASRALLLEPVTPSGHVPPERQTTAAYQARQGRAGTEEPRVSHHRIVSP